MAKMTSLGVLLVVLVGLAPVAAQADAVAIGIVCFSSTDSVGPLDTFRVFLEVLDGGVIRGAGQELNDGYPVTVAGAATGSGISLGFFGGTNAFAHPRWTTLESLDVNTLSGAGTCESANGGICGDLNPVTISIVSCP
jgi:hypothetical protein